MVNLIAVTLHARTSVEQKTLGLIARKRFAQDRQIALAVEAMPAMGIPGADDVIADLDLRHIAAHRFDDAGAFVAEHDRQRIGERALDHLQVGVAKPAGLDLHQDVGRRHRRHFERVDGHRLVDFVQYRCFKFHEFSLDLKIFTTKDTKGHEGRQVRNQEVITHGNRERSIFGNGGFFYPCPFRLSFVFQALSFCTSSRSSNFG